MRIVFLTHYFPPEVNAPANRTYEHCREWAAAGHEVHVITCVPSHPAGRPFHGYRKRWYQRETRDGIVVHRVWTYLAANSGVIKRTVNFLSFIPTAVWRAVRLGRGDVMIATSPQFFCAVAGWIAAALTRTPWIFELRDLWPDSIAAVGASRAYMPIRLLERLELRMYRSAAAVVCVSEAFVRNLASRGIDSRKLHFVPNGVDLALWTGGSRERGRRQLAIADDALLVSYIGTIGMAHDVGTILTAASRLKASRPDIRFAIVGDGAELPAVKARIAAEGLTNVTATGLVARQTIPDLLAATDLSLVTLKASDVFKTVLPSKMFESMAASKPIVLSVDGESRRLLERAGAGVAVRPGDGDALLASILSLAGDPDRRMAMGRAGRRFVEREFTRQHWAERYLRLIDDAIVVPARSVSQPARASSL